MGFAEVPRFRCPGRPQQPCGGLYFAAVYMLNEDGTTTLPIHVCAKCGQTHVAWDEEYKQWYATAHIGD